MDALELLRSDHDLVEKLFKQMEGKSERDNVALFKELKANLDAHAYIEETIFYPALQQDGDQEIVDLVSEALQEHIQAKTFLGELAASLGDKAKFDSLLPKLIEDVRHHVKEEENELFPLVKAQFDAETISDWGSQMESEKERFSASAETIHA